MSELKTWRPAVEQVAAAACPRTPAGRAALPKPQILDALSQSPAGEQPAVANPERLQRQATTHLSCGQAPAMMTRAKRAGRGERCERCERRSITPHQTDKPALNLDLVRPEDARLEFRICSLERDGRSLLA